MLQLAPLGSIADHDLGSGKVKFEKRFDILFHRDPADKDENRFR